MNSSDEAIEAARAEIIAVVEAACPDGTVDPRSNLRVLEEAIAARVRAEAVAERNEHWQQRLDDVRAELERPIAHERKLRGELLRSLWRAVHDRSDAPDHYLISEDELLCAVQDMHREGQCSEAEAVAEERQRLADAILPDHWQTSQMWGGVVRPACGRCRYGDGVPFLWPCPTRRAITGEPEPGTR